MRRTGVVGLFLCLILPGVVVTEVLDSATDGFSLRHSVEITADADDVYRTLTRGVGDWWHPDHTFTGDSGNLRMEARGGGCFCEKLGKGGEVTHLTVVHAEPGKLLRMSGGLGPLQPLAVSGSMAFTLTEVDGKVLGPLGRAVAHPFAWVAHDRLSGMHFERATLMLDAQHTHQHETDLHELWPLTRLLPTRWRVHARNADSAVLRVDVTDELLDLLGLAASGFDDRRFSDESWHCELLR